MICVVLAITSIQYSSSTIFKSSLRILVVGVWRAVQLLLIFVAVVRIRCIILEILECYVARCI